MFTQFTMYGVSTNEAIRQTAKTNKRNRRENFQHQEENFFLTEANLTKIVQIQKRLLISTITFSFFTKLQKKNIHKWEMVGCNQLWSEAL